MRARCIIILNLKSGLIFIFYFPDGPIFISFISTKATACSIRSEPLNSSERHSKSQNDAVNLRNFLRPAPRRGSAPDPAGAPPRTPAGAAAPGPMFISYFPAGFIFILDFPPHRISIRYLAARGPHMSYVKPGKWMSWTHSLSE